MLKSFKRVLLRRKYSSNTFETKKHNELRGGWVSRADPRSTKFTHQHVLRVRGSRMKAITTSEACLKAELIDLNNTPTSISKERLTNILNSIFANGCTDQLFEDIVGILRHELLDWEPEDRIELIKVLIQQIYKPDIHHYNALITIYLDNNIDFVPAEFLNYLCSQNIEPNDTTKYLIFKYYCWNGMIDKAMKIVSEIQDNNSKLYFNKICANLLIAYEKARNSKKTSCIIDLMKEENIVKDFNAFVVLMCIYAMRNDIKSITYIHNVCVSNHVNISSIDASRVLYILKTYGYQKSIPEVFNILSSTEKSQHIFSLVLKLLTFGQEEFAIESWGKYWDNVLKPNINQHAYQYIFFRRLFRNTSNLKETHKSTVEKYKQYDMLLRFQVLDGFNKDGDFVKYRSYISILLNENKYRLKSLHFWPLLAKCNKDRDLHGIFCIIDYMISQCGIQPCFDALTNFVIPPIIRSNYFINILRCLRVDENTMNNAIAYILLRQYRDKKVYQHLRLNESTYDYSLLSKALVDALVLNKDIYTFTRITRFLKDVNTYNTVNASNPEKNITSVSMDEYVLQIRQNFPKEQHLLTRLFKELQHQGITLSGQNNKMYTGSKGIQFHSKHKQLYSQSINGHGMDSRSMDELNNALSYFCVNRKTFIPVTSSSSGIAQLIKKLQELIQHNAALLEFLQKYYVLTNSSAVGDALEKCRNTNIENKAFLNPIKISLEAGRTRESLLKIRNYRWNIIKLLEEQQIQYSNQLTQNLMCVFKRYGPMPVLSILEYMSSTYHFLPHNVVDLMTEFQKLGTDECSRKFIGIYEKLDRQRCYSDLLFYYLKHNQLEDGVEALKKLDINSEHFALCVKESLQQADATLVNLLFQASSHLSAECRDSTNHIIMKYSSESKQLNEGRKHRCGINMEQDSHGCNKIAYSVI